MLAVRFVIFLGCLQATVSFFASAPALHWCRHDHASRVRIHLQEASSENDNDVDQERFRDTVRFLGRGKNAVVRPGVVLIAPPDEFHHYLRQAAVFVYAMGQDEDDVYVVRGVIIDHPTPFTIQEMMPSEAGGRADASPYLQNLLYRGGELGDAAFMLHADKLLGDEAEQNMIGTSGIYQGGLDYALQNGYAIDPDKAKFFFSYMEFTENELNEMLDNREEESTQWVSVEVPSDFVLNSEWERGEAWSRLRNAIMDR